MNADPSPYSSSGAPGGKEEILLRVIGVNRC